MKHLACFCRVLQSRSPQPNLPRVVWRWPKLTAGIKVQNPPQGSNGRYLLGQFCWKPKTTRDKENTRYDQVWVVHWPYANCNHCSNSWWSQFLNQRVDGFWGIHLFTFQVLAEDTCWRYLTNPIETLKKPTILAIMRSIDKIRQAYLPLHSNSLPNSMILKD